MQKLFSLFCAVLLLLTIGLPAFAEAPAPDVGQVQNVQVTVSTETSVSLQWNALEGAAGYRVYYFNETKNKYAALLTTTATDASVFSLSPGKTYRFRVRAFQKPEGKAVWGEPSKDAYAVTAPGKAVQPFIKDISLDTITLGWKKIQGATHYEIHQYDRVQKRFRLYGLSAHLQMTVQKLEPNKTYRFMVRAIRVDKGKYAAGQVSEEIRETTDTNGLPHTAWQAVKGYCNALNKAKSGGSYQLTHKKQIKTTDYAVSRASFSGTVKNMMQLFTGRKTSRYTVKNGLAAGKSMQSILPPQGQNVTLTPDDIKDYSAEKQKGGGYHLTLTLKEDGSLFQNGKTSKPKILSKAANYLRFERIDTTPIRLHGGKVLYDGATLVLSVDQKRRPLSLQMDVRAALELDCYAASVDFDTVILYDCSEQFAFSY